MLKVSAKLCFCAKENKGKLIVREEIMKRREERELIMIDNGKRDARVDDFITLP